MSSDEQPGLASNFDPAAIEQSVYSDWESSGFFAPSGNGEGYCIVIPPPNVTGTLHMGHAFNQTLMDTLIRYQRMSGRRALWQMGTDHAGIATQMLVERQLQAEGKTRHDLTRDEFIDRVWQWRESSGGTISKQIRRMGSSVDWSRERFTMDDGYGTAVLEVFVRLFDEGLIYRGKRLVNWDPALGTAISDLEVDNVEEQGHLWHFRYPLADGARTRDGADHVVVATTRPETMLGDSAVAVHPDDDRYQDLVGKEVILPLVNRRIPIIADTYVDPEFGSGCVKITPAHDFNDNEVGARHNLPLINVFDDAAAIVDPAPEKYRGMDRLVARKAVVADLDAANLLAQVQDHKLMVPRGDRSGAVVEPYLTDQWFVKIAPLAAPAIEAVENGSIEFLPKQYENVYFSWMRDIKDWTISRQQVWGHRIPAFYDANGKIYVARSEEEARSKHELNDDVTLTQDPDVLETWFSSALWPFATLGWPEEDNDLDVYLPTEVLITGHDIIFFWVARMIMMTLHFTGQIPFRKVYIHGLVRDADGQKMSKTKGNGLDPLDFIDGIGLEELVAKRTTDLTDPRMAAKIEKSTRKDFPEGIPAYGTDALRFTFCALATSGRDVRFDLNRIEGNRNFCNKLWNASRFVFMNTDGEAVTEGKRVLSAVDRWILSKAHHMLQQAQYALATYRFDLFASHLYEFVWHEYCDWYLELTKPLLWDESATAEEQRGTRHTLLEVLELLIRAMHPVMPYITETLWQEVAPRLALPGGTVMLQQYPVPDDVPVDSDAEAAIDWLKDVVTAVRNIRGEAHIKPGQTVTVLFADGSDADRARARQTEELLKRMAKVESIGWLAAGDTPPANALALVGNLKVMVPLAGVIDLAAERARLTKDISKREGELKSVEGKLGNSNFVDKAPAAVVDKEKSRAEDLRAALSTLRAQLESLE